MLGGRVSRAEPSRQPSRTASSFGARRILSRSHLGDRAETQKAATTKWIRAAGKQPRIEILAHGPGQEVRYRHPPETGS
jgi:hypothetical protein